MSSDKVPAEAFESLLPKVINILQLSQNPEGVASLEARKALLQATTDLKESLGRAQELANSLPGGEVTVEEQDAVIAMLEEMQSDRRRQLDIFASRTISTDTVAEPTKEPMDVDSEASTPTLLVDEI